MPGEDNKQQKGKIGNKIYDQTRPKKFAESACPYVSYPSLRSWHIAETVKGVTKNFKLYFCALR